MNIDSSSFTWTFVVAIQKEVTNQGIYWVASVVLGKVLENLCMSTCLCMCMCACIYAHVFAYSVRRGNYWSHLIPFRQGVSLSLVFVLFCFLARLANPNNSISAPPFPALRLQVCATMPVFWHVCWRSELSFFMLVQKAFLPPSHGSSSKIGL